MGRQVPSRKPCPTDVSDDEWAFAAPYLSLITADAPQRRHPPRKVFNALRWIVQTGALWCCLPSDLPPWPPVYQQTRRRLAAGVFEGMVHDLWEVLRWLRRRADLDVIKVVPLGRQDGRLRMTGWESGRRTGHRSNFASTGTSASTISGSLSEAASTLEHVRQTV